jgi:hypothetical protein
MASQEEEGFKRAIALMLAKLDENNAQIATLLELHIQLRAKVEKRSESEVEKEVNDIYKEQLEKVDQLTQENIKRKFKKKSE